MCKLVQYQNFGYIADIKLPHVKNITELAAKTRNISKIVLFGSSIEDRCTANSDIDIAVFGELSKGRYIDSTEFRTFKNGLFRFDRDQDYDVLYFKENSKHNDAIMFDINKGVEIYRRAAD